DPEIRELDLAFGRDHQVRGLEVPVDHALVMSVLKGIAKLDRQIDDLAPGQLSSILEHPLQGHALHVLHREVGRSLESSTGQPANDVGMPELLEDLCFALEPIEDLTLLGELAVNDLHGGWAAGRLLGRAEDNTHRA